MWVEEPRLSLGRRCYHGGAAGPRVAGDTPNIHMNREGRGRQGE